MVTTTEKVTKIIVNKRYFPEMKKKEDGDFVIQQNKLQKKPLPSNGTDIDVGGIISASNKKNTVSDRRIEMERDT